MIPSALRDTMLAAADAEGAHIVRARQTFVREAVDAEQMIYPIRAIVAGTKVAKLRCSPPPCVELWVVGDGEIEADWVVG